MDQVWKTNHLAGWRSQDVNFLPVIDYKKISWILKFHTFKRASISSISLFKWSQREVVCMYLHLHAHLQIQQVLEFCYFSTNNHLRRLSRLFDTLFKKWDQCVRQPDRPSAVTVHESCGTYVNCYIGYHFQIFAQLLLKQASCFVRAVIKNSGSNLGQL